MTKRGKRKICLLLDSDIIEAFLDICAETNTTMNQTASAVARAGLGWERIDPFKRPPKSLDVGDLKQTLAEVHVELERVRDKLRDANS